jgi:hypothetical protein
LCENVRLSSVWTISFSFVLVVSFFTEIVKSCEILIVK